MEKIKNITYKIILFILLILLVYIIYCSIFDIYKPLENLNPLIIILGIIVILFFLLRLSKVFGKISDKKVNLIAIILCTIFLIGLVAVGSNLVSIPLYDLSHLQRESIIMLENGRNFITDYFQIYTSQIPSTIIVYFIYKLGTLLSVSNLRIFGTIINAIFITITAFFTYLSAKEISNHRKALVTLIFFIINPIFYLYVSYFYTDTLCMPFSAISIYLFIKGIKSDSKKTKIIFFLLSGLFVAIGYKIRVVVAIFLIAIIAQTILNNKLGKKVLLNITSLLIGFIIGLMFCKLIEMPFKIEKNKDLEIPVTHWVMMGLNQEKDGQYNSKDYNYTRSKDGYSKKVKANLGRTKKRLQSLGVDGLLPFIGTKLKVNWSNGEYIYTTLLANVEKITDIYDYTVGNKKIFVLYYAQICKSTILLIVTMVALSEIRKKNKNKGINQTILISIFGAFLFYLLWEVKPRYSLTFLPWFILLIPNGISIIEKAEFNKIKIPWKQILSIGTIVISICLAILNFNKYTVEESIHYDKKVHQERQNKMYKISDKIINQTFYTDKKFNCIKLKFSKKENVKTTNYKFELLDSNGNKLYEKDFSSDIIDSGYYSFKFDTVEPNINEKFTIQIYSKDATDKNSINIAMYFDEIYDVYPNGNAIINDEEKNADIVFSVQEVSKRPYVSKGVYIFICIVILIIELVSFYPYIIYKNK